MKARYFAALLMLTLLPEGDCQKYALVGDTARFLCKSDSIEFYFTRDYLMSDKVITLIELHYFYDNGRYEDEVKAFLWNEEGDSKIKIITGCDETQDFAIREIDDRGLLHQYFQRNFADLEHVLYCGTSHDYGYRFTVSKGAFSKQGYVRDYRRGIDNFHRNDRYENAEQLRREAELNPLVKWLNDLDKLVRDEIAR